MLDPMSNQPPKKAMLLAAGRGTRLAPLTDTTPKPLLPVQGKPLIRWQLEALARAGVEEVVINLHHLGEQIASELSGDLDLNLTLHFSHETELLETAGGIIQALPLLGDEPFLVMNGDIFTDFDFTHLRPIPDWAQAHLVLTPRPSHRPGDFLADLANQCITARGDDYVYCGISIWRPECLTKYPPGRRSLAEIMFALIDAHALSAQLHDGDWHDIGTPEQYQAIR